MLLFRHAYLYRHVHLSRPSSSQSNLLGLTSWDVYKTELESGMLEWSPSHKSEHFWKDNHKVSPNFDLNLNVPHPTLSNDALPGLRGQQGWFDLDLNLNPNLNLKAFEANNCSAIKQLVALLASEDPKVLAIVCSDISELIKHHPEGRRLVVQYGAKALAMGVLKHPDPTVQKHALTCVQRMMVINWEYLNRS
jgi:V-type H+-transporting ATPase subunit H